MLPFLRWAGSKRLLLPKLRPYVPTKFRRYIEPFAGSACLFFDLEPDDAILGDLNPELVCALRAVQKQPAVVIECLRRLPLGEDGYYEVRRRDPASLATSEIAARFIYLNHYCFNGIFRTSRRGHFNVPYGPPKSGAFIDEGNLLRASHLLKRAVILEGDFAETVAQADHGDFVYLDPPFAVSGRRVFAEYGPGSFSKEDLPRLAGLLKELDEKGAVFVVSYAESREARDWLTDWTHRRVRTRRNIAGFANSRRSSYELMVTNAS